MTVARWLVPVLFIALLAAPLLLRGERTAQPAADHALSIITPHNEQIRYEFERGFAEWIRRQPGWEDVNVAVHWRVPGGTSEIRMMLVSQFQAAVRDGREVGGDDDLMFGGGQFDHDQLKRGVTWNDRQVSISEPIDFDAEFLDEVYGVNDLAGALLHDPDGHWFGTALSSFGMLYNNDLLRDLDLDPPRSWAALCHPDLLGWIALGHPMQSSSIAKSFDTILQHHGWSDGWQVLRRMGANARYFSASSSKVPIDVSQGDAAVGVCIDFYGRYQAQAVSDAGDRNRLGYIDPPGLTLIDADPISLLRGAPNRDLAIMFIRFCLSEEGQSLWQFARKEGDQFGPRRFELRRLPIRRSMYVDHADRFVDRVNPYESARPFEDYNRDSWTFLAPLFTSMVIDNHKEIRAAWEAIVRHPAYRSAIDRLINPDHPIVGAGEVNDPTLAEMLRLFDAMPSVSGPDGASYDLADVESLPIIRRGWFEQGWVDENLWPAPSTPARTLRAQWSEFFRTNYNRIIRLADEAR